MIEHVSDRKKIAFLGDFNAGVESIMNRKIWQKRIEQQLSVLGGKITYYDFFQHNVNIYSLLSNILVK